MRIKIRRFKTSVFARMLPQRKRKRHLVGRKQQGLVRSLRTQLTCRIPARLNGVARFEVDLLGFGFTHSKSLHQVRPEVEVLEL